MQQKISRLSNRNLRSGTATVWIIGITAVIALVLAWSAYNRSGEDVLSTVSQELEEVQQETAAETAEFNEDVRIAAARAEARADLLALRAELEAEATYEDVQQKLDQISADLAEAYDNASAEFQVEYQEIQRDLESLGDNIRNETGNALEVLAGLLLKLEAEVRTEE